MKERNTNRKRDARQGLPKGLDDTIAAFVAGCDAKNKRVADEVGQRIVERFADVYADNEETWDRVAAQVLTIARLCGRLAALYADRDHTMTVEWVHARFGLRDGQAECQAVFREDDRGKHCKGVDLVTP